MANKFWDVVSVECGSLAVVANDVSVVRVCFETSVAELNTVIETLYPGSQRSSTLFLGKALQQLIEYFSGARKGFTLPLNTSHLSSFSHTIHQTLIRIPYGSIVTYGQLAAMAGFPAAARATGRAMAMNPFPILVPCHRVVNANGQIGHYSAANGAKTKEWLIDLECKYSELKMER